MRLILAWWMLQSYHEVFPFKVILSAHINPTKTSKNTESINCIMEAKCSFELLHEQECHKLSYTRKIILKKLTDMANDIYRVLLWRAELLHTINDVTHDALYVFIMNSCLGQSLKEKERNAAMCFKNIKRRLLVSIKLHYIWQGI